MVNRLRRGRSLATVAIFASIAVALLAGCSTAASPSFDASAPCTADARLPGAYPALEALVPRILGGRPPDRLDSGRNCTTTNLGTLADHGIKEVHFAGGLWGLSSTSGVTLAVFQAPGLTAAEIGEWYEASARLSSKTAGLHPTRPIIDGRQAYRLDLLSSDYPEAVVAWPSADGSYVQVVIAATVPEAQVQAGIAAFGGLGR